MPGASRIAVVLALLALPPALDARDIHYGAVGDDAVLECDRQHWRGRSEDARLCYANLLHADTPAATKAEAAWALNNLKQANDWFRTAMDEAPGDHDTKVRWGDLFAASHQNGEAMAIYSEVLAEEPAHAFALLGAATVLVDRFEDAAGNYLQPIIDGVVPDEGAYLGALLLLARMSLENGDYDEADEYLSQAADVVAKYDWPPLEVYALRAALDLLNGVDGGRWTELALAYNPNDGGIYATPAHFYMITRRYRDAIDMYQKAVDVQPDLAAAHEALGINLLRDNQLTRARTHLERAYELDPFSPRSVNTLRLVDSFSDFRLVDDPPRADGDVPLVLRLHKDESAALAPYVIDLARDSIEVFTERYDFRLREPVVIEMYPDHDDFAVRTVGMPGVGILGAAFGYLVALDSPSGRPAHEFQWGTTLWHEMAHVFHLGATNHLVPRWYTEGLAVFEEWRSGPNPGVRIPMSVYNAMQEDRFLPVSELDEGFLRPTYEEQVIVSYMQAGLVCDYIDRHHGDGKLRELLYAYRDGLQTPEAISTVLGVTPSEFDTGFAAYVDAEHGAVLARLETWHHDQLAYRNAMQARDWNKAIELATGLIEILPQYVEPDSPYLAAATAQHELGDNAAAMRTMQTFWQNGGYDPDSLRRYAGWLVDAGERDKAIDVLYSINLVDPLDHDLHGELGDLLLAAGRAGEALREFEVAVALEPHDMATAWYRLARAERELGNIEQAQGHLLQALDVAPNFRPAQRLLLELAGAGKD